MADYDIKPPTQTVSDAIDTPKSVTDIEYHADGQKLVVVVNAPGIDPIHSPRFPASDVVGLDISAWETGSAKIKKHVITTYGGGTPK